MYVNLHLILTAKETPLLKFMEQSCLILPLAPCTRNSCLFSFPRWGKRLKYTRQLVLVGLQMSLRWCSQFWWSFVHFINLLKSLGISIQLLNSFMKLKLLQTQMFNLTLLTETFKKHLFLVPLFYQSVKKHRYWCSRSVPPEGL